jgi:hypothetical protein
MEGWISYRITRDTAVYPLNLNQSLMKLYYFAVHCNRGYEFPLNSPFAFRSALLGKQFAESLGIKFQITARDQQHLVSHMEFLDDVSFSPYCPGTIKQLVRNNYFCAHSFHHFTELEHRQFHHNQQKIRVTEHGVQPNRKRSGQLLIDPATCDK